MPEDVIDHPTNPQIHIAVLTCSLDHGGSDNRNPQNIGLHLQEEIVGAHPAVDLQTLQSDAAVAVHRLQKLFRLETHGLQSRATNVRLYVRCRGGNNERNRQ